MEDVQEGIGSSIIGYTGIGPNRTDCTQGRLNLRNIGIRASIGDCEAAHSVDKILLTMRSRVKARAKAPTERYLIARLVGSRATLLLGGVRQSLTLRGDKLFE
ncbi:hypothetical protein BHE74_00002677 [Ensete ventricosum]|nr:hypothetical protein BHE74_00002677 [Ensete ventricosum]